MPICINLCILSFHSLLLMGSGGGFGFPFVFCSLCPNAIPPLFLLFQADCIRRSLFHKNSQKHHFFAPKNLHISKIFRTFAPDLGDPTSLDILLTKSPDVPPP